MGSPALPKIPALEMIRGLYDEGRFLDAYAATETLWSSPAVVPALDPAALVLGHRLARFLGSTKIADGLAREAHRVAPDRPEVRYFCPLAGRRPLRLLELLERFEREPELRSGDDELDASWCASHATLSAVFRDFDRAEARLLRARELDPDDPWIDACEASVRLSAHDWAAARTAAERAFAGRPWGGRASGSLAEALQAEGRFVEASDRVLTAAQAHGQSIVPFEIGLWAGIQGCRRRQVPNPKAWAEERSPLADRLEALAPLADRPQRRSWSALRAQLALLREDLDRARVEARAVQSPWYSRLADHLDEGAHRPRVLLEHAMLRQEHDTCLPASAAVALSTFGVEVDHDELVRAVTSNGTPLHRLAAWGHARGWTVRYFRATRAAAEGLIDRKLAFVLTLAATDSAHAWAAIGYDPASGLTLLHDPSTNDLAEMDLDAAAADQWPWGPRALLIAPPERARAAEDLELPDETASTALADNERSLDEAGATDALEALDAAALTPEWADLERTLLLRVAGQPSEARPILLELFERAPESVFVRKGLLDTTLDAAPFEEGRRTLQAMVEARRPPTEASTRRWLEPEPVVEITFAQLLMQSAEHFEEAGRRLERALGRAPLSGYALSALANLRDRQDDDVGAALAYRLAAAVEPERNDYAYGYAEHRLRHGDEAGAVRYLEIRAEGRQREVGADGPWRVLVELLETAGRPDAARAALDRARARWPEDGRLAAFAAERHLLAGRPEEAQAALDAAKALAPPAAVLTVEVLAAHLEGDLSRAESLVEALVALEPGQIAHRRALLNLARDQRGPDAAAEILEGWRASGEEPDVVELLEIEHLREEAESAADRDRLEARFEARIARHPADVWALVEWASLQFDDERRRGARDDETTGFSAARGLAERALAVHPGLSSAEALLGRIRQEEGDLAGARQHFARAVESSPGYLYALDRLGVVTAQLGDAAWPATEAALDHAYGRPGNRLVAAGPAAVLLMRHRGRATADEALRRWSRGRDDDPNLAVARGELELADRPGAAAATELLEATAEVAARHPLHPGLGALRARAFELTADFARAAEAYEALVRTQPRDGGLKTEWLQTLEGSGAVERALEEWQRWARAAPRDVDAVLGWADALHRAGRPEAAAEALAEACGRAPQVPALWRQRGLLLDRLGRREAVLALARELEERFPDRAWAAHEQAMMLAQESIGAPIGEVTRCFERATALDRSVWAYVCDHTDYLIAQGHHEPARAALEDFLARAPESAFVLGALAELDRREGNRDEAWRHLEAAFARDPSYMYGWGLALGWLEDEGDPEHVRSVLERMGTQARKDPELASRRLRVLAAAGVPAEELETDWKALLAERPADLAVLARRYDALSDVDGDAAEAALRALERFHPDQPATRSRRIERAARTGDRERAIEDALELIFAPRDAQIALVRALRALDGVGERLVLARGIRARLAAGAPVRSNHLMTFTTEADEAQDEGALELVAAALFEAAPLGAPEHAFSLTLSRLCNYGESARAVLRYAEAAPDRFDDDDQLWMVRGQARARLGDLEGTRAALRGWRDRPGIEQWGLGILAWACSELGDDDEAIAVIEHGLFRLPLTGGAPEMARRGCLLALRRQDQEAFLRVADRLERVRFGPPERMDVAIGLFTELFAGAADAVTLDRSFRAMKLPKKDELVQQWNRAVYPHAPWWMKARITLGF